MSVPLAVTAVAGRRAGGHRGRDVSVTGVFEGRRSSSAEVKAGLPAIDVTQNNVTSFLDGRSLSINTACDYSIFRHVGVEGR